MNLELARDFAEKMARDEDSAVAEYIRAQANYLVLTNKDLSKYELVRESEGMNGGITMSKTTWWLRPIEEKS